WGLRLSSYCFGRPSWTQFFKNSIFEPDLQRAFAFPWPSDGRKIGITHGLQGKPWKFLGDERPRKSEEIRRLFACTVFEIQFQTNNQGKWDSIQFSTPGAWAHIAYLFFPINICLTEC